MGKVIHLNPPRTLAHIIAEILLDEGRLRNLMQKCTGRDPTESEDEAWSLLEDRLHANRTEARALFKQMTGIDWEEIEGALA